MLCARGTLWGSRQWQTRVTLGMSNGVDKDIGKLLSVAVQLSRTVRTHPPL